MTTKKMIELFEAYITSFPFKGDFILSEFIKLKSKGTLEKDVSNQSFIELREWYFDSNNKHIINKSFEKYKNIVESNNTKYNKRFSEYRDSLKLRVSTPADMKYIGMFDES